MLTFDKAIDYLCILFYIKHIKYISHHTASMKYKIQQLQGILETVFLHRRLILLSFMSLQQNLVTEVL